MSAYLFTHFTNDGKEDKEHIWFSVSRDGLNWQDLGGKEPFLTCSKGTTGIRDPFIVYDEKLKKYYIIATDLCTTKGGNWHAFSHKGSRNLIIWESEDLISWTEPRLAEVGIDKAGCVWAPEAIYCREREEWFVFWASCVREKGELHHKQRIYAAFTKDFIAFSPAFKYIDASTDVIDTNIVWDKGWYYRFSKDETNKKITVERCRKLIEDSENKFEKIDSELLNDFFGLEGPEAYYLEDRNQWCLIVDQYHTQRGYLPLLCNDLSTGEFYIADESEYYMDKRQKRHGGVIKISDEEMERLVEYFAKIVTPRLSRGVLHMRAKPYATSNSLRSTLFLLLHSLIISCY